MINKAISGKKIINATDSELAKRLSLIYFMIGLRPHHFPTKEEDVFLFGYIRKNYPNTTLDEIYLAFDLAIKNVLDISDIKCYDQFSIEYFVRIMTGYFKYAKLIVSYEPKKKVELLTENVSISVEEKHADIQELYTHKHIDNSIIPLYIYDWMVELGYIKLTDDDKSLLYKQAIDKILLRLQHTHQANPLDRSARINYNNYLKRVRENFIDITDKETIEIHNVFKRLAIIHQIKNDKKNATKFI